MPEERGEGTGRGHGGGHVIPSRSRGSSSGRPAVGPAVGPFQPQGPLGARRSDRISRNPRRRDGQKGVPQTHCRLTVKECQLNTTWKTPRYYMGLQISFNAMETAEQFRNLYITYV